MSIPSGKPAHDQNLTDPLVAALRAVVDLADEYERAADGGEPEHVRAANVAAYIRRAMETALGEARP